MSLEMITFDENGQGAIDFDALELITSVDFVDAVKSQMEFDFEICHFENLSSSATIFLKRDTSLFLITLFRNTNTIHKSYLSKFDLSTCVQILGGKLSWEK